MSFSEGTDDMYLDLDSLRADLANKTDMRFKRVLLRSNLIEPQE